MAAAAGVVDSAGVSLMGRFVSHMSGTTSALAGAVARGGWAAAGLCLLPVATFVAGAAASGACSEAGGGLSRPRCAGLLAAEAALLLAALTSSVTPLSAGPRTWALLALLPASMGLQNSLGAEALRHHPRTTHVTGVLTSFGYHLGRRVRDGAAAPGARSLHRSAAVFCGFLAGGLCGRLGFEAVGAAVLLAPASLAAALGFVLLQTPLRPED